MPVCYNAFVHKGATYNMGICPAIEELGLTFLNEICANCHGDIGNLIAI